MKAISSLAIAAATGVMFMAGAASPASAASCAYTAVDTSNHIIVGYAKARKGSTACTRARRECNRKVDRARRKGEFGRSHGCQKARLG